MCGEIAPQHSSGWESAWPGLSTACSWGLLETSLSVAAARHSGQKKEDSTSDLLEDQVRAFFRFKRRHDLQTYSQACISMFRSMPSFPSRDQWSMLWMERGTGMCYNALDVRCTHPYMCAEDRKLGVLYCSWLTPLRQSLSLGLELVWQPAYPQRPSRLCPRQSKRHMRPCQAGKDSFFFIHIGHWSIC